MEGWDEKSSKVPLLELPYKYVANWNSANGGPPYFFHTKQFVHECIHPILEVIYL